MSSLDWLVLQEEKLEVSPEQLHSVLHGNQVLKLPLLEDLALCQVPGLNFGSGVRRGTFLAPLTISLSSPFCI